MAKKTAQAAEGERDNIDVEYLLLDVDNPRLAAEENLKSQDDLVKFLWEEMAVDEIALSIAKNGFFDEEPLFVIPHASRKDYWIVVEGNRRLAAVKLLTDEALRKRVGATSLPSISLLRRTDLTDLPVSKYRTREELWQFFGFRHINGPKPWDPYSKAKYISQVHEEYGIALDEIAASIGDRHATVRRLYRGIKLLEQAENQSLWAAEDRTKPRLAFSHLYTAAAQGEFQKFLGISDDTLKKNPVPAAHKKDLQDLLLWLYGSKSREIDPLVVTQSPDLNNLREVVASKEGLQSLRSGLSLKSSLDAAIGDERRFADSIFRARQELHQAKSSVTNGYKGQPELLKAAEETSALAETILDEMRAARQKKR
jgi:hypothetical protein